MQMLNHHPTKVVIFLLAACALGLLGCVFGDGLQITSSAPATVASYSLSTCYDSTSEMDDYVSDTDFPECDASWVLNTVDGDKIELDVRTGLMWSRESATGDIATEVDGANNGAINWFEAVGKLADTSGTCTNGDHTGCNPDGESYCGKLNTLSYGGYGDWRAPGQKELMQAYVDGASGQATVFNKDHNYWGNTTESDNALFAAFFRFGYGFNSDGRKNSATYYGICVRKHGGAQISQINGCIATNEVDDYSGAGANECDSSWTNETLEGDLVSKDPLTRMMWSRESNSTDFASEVDGVADGWINWYEAVGETQNTSGTCDAGTHTGCNPDGEGFCQILNAELYAGFSDWRAPGQKELMQAYIDGGSQSAVFDVDSWYAGHTTESDDSLWGAVRRFGFGNGEDYLKHGGWVKGICVRSY